MMPKTIENALANGYTTEGQSYKEIVRGDTLQQTGLWELSGDDPGDCLEIPYTAVFRFGKPRRPDMEAGSLVTRKGHRRKT